MAATAYLYRAVDATGAVREGSFAATDETTVVEHLRRMGLRPVTITPERRSGLHRELRLPTSGRVKPAELAVFFRQLATMVGSGLPLLRTLTVLSEQTHNKTLSGAVAEVREDIAAGEPLSDGLAKHPKVFDEFIVSMVRAGERAGAIDTVLNEIAATVEARTKLRRKVRSAMSYPVAIGGLAGLVLLAMLIFLVPMFEKIYSDLNGQLPAPTRVLIKVSDIVKGNAPVTFAVVALAALVLSRWKRTTQGRAALDAFKMRVPILGTIVHKAALSRFARSLSVLLSSGVPILEALQITSRTVQNAPLEKACGEIEEAIRAGKPLSAAMAKRAVFPPMVVQMVAAGEETGDVEPMLAKVRDFLDSELEAIVNSITSLIEPLLLVVMGVTVGGVVVALYLPMFRVITLVR